MVAEVVELVAEVVGATDFTVGSKQLKGAVQSVTILKSLGISGLIYGEDGIGRESFASHIFPNAKIIDFIATEELQYTLLHEAVVIISNFAKSDNLTKSFDLIKEIKNNSYLSISFLQKIW